MQGVPRFIPAAFDESDWWPFSVPAMLARSSCKAYVLKVSLRLYVHMHYNIHKYLATCSSIAVVLLVWS